MDNGHFPQSFQLSIFLKFLEILAKRIIIGYRKLDNIDRVPGKRLAASWRPASGWWGGVEKRILSRLRQKRSGERSSAHLPSFLMAGRARLFISLLISQVINHIDTGGLCKCLIYCIVDITRLLRRDVCDYRTYNGSRQSIRFNDQEGARVCSFMGWAGN